MRKQDRPQHEIASFARYINKVFDFRTVAATLTDSRAAPEISPAAVFLAVLLGLLVMAQQYLIPWIIPH